MPDWQGGISNQLHWAMLNSENSRPWRPRRRVTKNGVRILLHGYIEPNHWKPTTAPASGFFLSPMSRKESSEFASSKQAESNAMRSLRDSARNTRPKSQ